MSLELSACSIAMISSTIFTGLLLYNCLPIKAKFHVKPFFVRKKETMLMIHELHCEKTRFLPRQKQRHRISFAVIAKLISASVFATQLVQFLYFLNSEFPVSSHLLHLHSLVCVRPGRKPRRPVFSRHSSHIK